MKNDKFVFMVDYKNLKEIDKINQELIEVAKIRNMTQKKDVMWVLYEKKKIYKTNHIMYTNIINNKWVAIIRKEAIELLIKNPKTFSFDAFHELGHFVNGDYNTLKKDSSTSLSEERKKMILEGKVMQNELDADLFAVKQVGKNIAVRCLDYSIKRRKKLDNSQAAIKELELRKRNIINSN